MNKYAEEMQKVAINRLSLHLAENPATAARLKSLMEAHPAVAEGGFGGIRSGVERNYTPEERRAAQRALEASKPMLRSPAQYAAGLWGHAERRIPEELSRAGFSPERTHTNGHGVVPSSDPDVLSGFLGSLGSSHQEALSESAATKLMGEGGPLAKLRAMKRERKARAGYQQGIDAVHGRAFVHRYDPETPILTANPRGGGIASFATTGTNLPGIKVGRSGSPVHGVENMHTAILNVPDNPGLSRTDTRHDRALSMLNQAHVAHHELDELKYSHHMGGDANASGFFSHATPAVLGREAQRMRGNPYLHLSTDVGSLQQVRHVTGERDAIHSLLGPAARRKPYGSVTPTGRQINDMAQMHNETATAHAARFLNSAFRDNPLGELADAHDAALHRYGRFDQ